MSQKTVALIAQSLTSLWSRVGRQQALCLTCPLTSLLVSPSVLHYAAELTRLQRGLGVTNKSVSYTFIMRGKKLLYHSVRLGRAFWPTLRCACAEPRRQGPIQERVGWLGLFGEWVGVGWSGVRWWGGVWVWTRLLAHAQVRMRRHCSGTNPGRAQGRSCKGPRSPARAGGGE